jgi:hypothetical protein
VFLKSPGSRFAGARLPVKPEGYGANSRPNRRKRAVKGAGDSHRAALAVRTGLETCGGKNVDVEAQQLWNCRRAEDYSLTLLSSQAPQPGDGGEPPILPFMPRRLVIIDSQSLFDWMVFRDPACESWSQALGGGGWEWIFTSEMRGEFDFVAAKGFGGRWPVDAAAVASTWTLLAREVPVPPPAGAATRLPCTDPDDQKFIDLAISARAHTLVTRDKALLRLARKALERHGVNICRPAAWSAQLAG